MEQGDIETPPNDPIPPALETAAATSWLEMEAIPASMIGHLIPRSSVSSVEKVCVGCGPAALFKSAVDLPLDLDSRSRIY